jgi:hypothetical protein
MRGLVVAAVVLPSAVWASCAPVHTMAAPEQAALEARLSGVWQIAASPAAEARDRQQADLTRQVSTPAVETSNIARGGSGAGGNHADVTPHQAFEDLDANLSALESAYVQDQVRKAAQKAEDATAYFNSVGRALLAPADRVDLACAGSVATVALDGASLSYTVSGQAQAERVDGAVVHVTSHWRNGGLVQELQADHDLKIERTFEPSADGQRLTVTVTLVSPKVKPEPRPFVRAYTRGAGTGT